MGKFFDVEEYERRKDAAISTIHIKSMGNIWKDRLTLLIKYANQEHNISQKDMARAIKMDIGNLNKLL